MDFKKFRKNRKKMSNAVKKMKDRKPSYVDERFWSPTVDKMGNADAVIRFLPQSDDPEIEPVIMKFTHGFKENGKWFFCDCPTTFGEKCPADEYAKPFWDDDTDESRAMAAKYSRKKQFISNILVVNDLANPENNGKVFLFKFGIKIYEMFMGKIDPDSELDEQILVYDPIDGCDFKLKRREIKGWVNYDQSEFYSKQTPIAKTEKEMIEIFSKIRPLDEFLDKKKLLKPYSELKKNFIGVVGKKAAQFFSKREDCDDSIEETVFEDKAEAEEDVKNEKVIDNTAKEKSTQKEVLEDNKEEKNTINKEEDTDGFDDDDFDFDMGDDDFNFDD